MELLDGLFNSTLVAYSDGVQDEIGCTSWGPATFHEARTTKARGSPANAEVYDAEAVGAFEAPKLAKDRIRAGPGIKEIILFLDNSAVADGILGPIPASSQGAYMGLRKIANELLPAVIIKVA